MKVQVIISHTLDRVMTTGTGRIISTHFMWDHKAPLKHDIYGKHTKKCENLGAIFQRYESF